MIFTHKTLTDMICLTARLRIAIAILKEKTYFNVQWFYTRQSTGLARSTETRSLSITYKYQQRKHTYLMDFNMMNTFSTQ